MADTDPACGPWQGSPHCSWSVGEAWEGLPFPYMSWTTCPGTTGVGEHGPRLCLPGGGQGRTLPGALWPSPRTPPSGAAGTRPFCNQLLGPALLWQGASWRAAPRVSDLWTWLQKSRGWVGPSQCCPKYLAVLSSLSGSSSDTHEAEAIHQGSCQEDGTLFSKQRINMPGLMIMNGRAVPIIRAGSGEDLAPASSFAMALP